MANTLKIKRGTAATIPQGQLAEPLFTTDTYDLYIGKGSGGNQRIQNYIASGTSSQFLKGDGTLDSTSYEPLITAGTTLEYYRGDKTFQTLDTSVVPENGPIYFTEPRVRATVLTGLNLSGGGTIAATDSILTAFGKVQNQISALVGGATYQGTWNASTNTPTLASGTGTKGYYYVVSVAGSTNLDGITDWKIGDWAIFNGTTWDKVDNTDAVSSVNGFTGAVNLALDNISDVSAASPTNAQLLRFNGTSSLWENWTPTFEPALTKGNLTEATSSVLTITGGTGAVIGSGTTIQVASAGASQAGVVTTSAQTFAGVKTFSSTPVVPALHLADMTAGTGALYYNTTAKRLTLANYNADGIVHIEVNGGAAALILNADLSMRLPGYTTNGFVKFSNSDGTLAVDTNTYLTGNQTITLSGDVTGSGSTAISTTIANNAVTTSKINNAAITAAKLATFGAGDAINWAANTDNGFIKFVSSGDAAGESYLEIGTGDNGDEPIRFTQKSGAVTYTRVYIETDGELYRGGGTKYVYNSGTWGINTTGSAATLTTARNFTINGTAKSFDGSANVSWTAAEIGLTSYLPLTGGTLTGDLTISANEPTIYLTKTGTDAGAWRILGSTGGTLRRFRIYDNVDGVDRFVVFKSGNVGVATTTDDGYKFYVNGTSYFNGALSGTSATFLSGSSTTIGLIVGGAGGAGSTQQGQIRFGDAGTVYKIQGGQDYLAFNFVIGTTNVLSLASSGAATFSSSVGVGGTTSPVKTLEVRGTLAISNSAASYWYMDRDDSDGRFKILTDGDAERFTILTGGSVGIGTTSPNAKLHIQGTGAVLNAQSTDDSVPARVVNLSNGISSIGFQANGSTNSFNVRVGCDVNDFIAYTNNTERMRITSGGNVLIGTTTDASTKLYVNGAGRFDGNLSVGTNASGSKFSVQGSGGATGVTLTLENGGGVIALNDPMGIIDFYSNDPSLFSNGVFGRISVNNEFNGAWNGTQSRVATYMAFSTSANATLSEKMRLRSNGVFSIGNTNGTGSVLDIIPSDTTSNGIILGTTYNGTGSYGPLVFETGGTERMRITSGGNVGIGTTSPGKALHVIGGGRFSGDLELGGGAYNWIMSTQGDTNWGFGMFNSGSSFYPTVYLSADSSAYTVRGFRIRNVASGGSNIFVVDGDGKVTALSFFESSDARLKTLIDKKIDYNAIANIEAKYYKKGEREELGYFAQDVQPLLNSAVTMTSNGYLDLSYRQVHTAKIAALEAKIKELEAKLK